MEKVKVILNPYAGRGNGRRAAGLLEAAFRKGNVPFDLTVTSAPGEATYLAQQARQQGYPIVAAAGGDGTINEVVNGLALATPEDQPVHGLAVLPVGSGNDFADMIGIPRNLDAAVHAIYQNNTRRVDLGRMEAFDGKNSIHRYFDNNLGMGFEAQVTVESRKIKRLRGFAIYLWAVFRALRAYDQPHFEIHWTESDGSVHTVRKPLLLVSIGNSRRTGGGFYLTPDAVMDDGLLELGFAKALSKVGILMLLPKAMSETGLRAHEAVRFARIRSVCISAQQPVPVHADGEIVSLQAERLSIEVQPNRLEVLA